MTKHFVFDIDGTLIDTYHGHDHIEPKLYEALLTLKTLGHRLYIATGRSKSLLPIQVQSFPFDGYFLTNGAYVEVDGEVVSNQVFNHQDLTQIKNFAKTNKGMYYFLTGHLMYTEDKQHPVHEEVRKIWPIPNLLEDCFEVKDVECNQIMYLCEDMNDLSKIQAMMNQSYDYVIHEGTNSFDILLKNINKGAILKNYFDSKAISPDDIYVFGDAHNDLEMFDIAKHKIAMGNACDALKEKASFITLNVEENGIVHALNFLNVLPKV